MSLDEYLEAADGVMDTATALSFLTRRQLHWRVASGRWQRPCRGVLVAHSGPLEESQILRVALLAAGRQSALGGLTAAWLDGFTGFGDKAQVSVRPVHVIVPAGFKPRVMPPTVNTVIHYSRTLTELDVHPLRQPRRTRIARSLIDAAAWMATDRGAMAVLAAGVQQRLVRVEDLRRVAERTETLKRRALIVSILGDIAGGAEALSELDFTRRVIRAFRLPEPSRQVARRDSRGRRRWIDVMWDEDKLVVEIDGAQHVEDPLQRWDDMDRDNDLQFARYRTLRFPAWLVRQHPELVASEVLKALRPRRARS
jgi:very-short-patch-repair endonuclease